MHGAWSFSAFTPLGEKADDTPPLHTCVEHGRSAAPRALKTDATLQGLGQILLMHAYLGDLYLICKSSATRSSEYGSRMERSWI